jgi:hypothetical protein
MHGRDLRIWMQFKHVMRGLDPRISSLVADGRIKSGHDVLGNYTIGPRIAFGDGHDV